MRTRRLAPLVVVLLLLAGCVSITRRQDVNPYPPAPPDRTEIAPLPPVSEDPVIWQPGHWDWIGNAFTWRDGRWVGRAGHGSMWQTGYWSNTTGTWLWMPAHWVSPG